MYQSSEPWYKSYKSKDTSKDNLWVIIGEELDIDTAKKQPLVRTHIDWYSDNTNHLYRILLRAEPYLYHIVTELNARDLPLAFALIPVVESAYDPSALSRKGAAGLWQLMPGTATQYGANQTGQKDNRGNLEYSTAAALDYLVYLGDFFDGDWHLALAAYNAGEGTVKRAIQRNEEAGLPTDFWSLKLPRETKQYVPRVLALGEIISEPSIIDLTLPHAPNTTSAYFTEQEIMYVVKSGDNLWKIAKTHQVRISDIMVWNDISEQQHLLPGQKLKIWQNMPMTLEPHA